MRELQLAEKTLNALEANGVGNWDGYDSAMESIKNDIAREDARLAVLDEIIEVLQQGVDFPAGREAGASFTDMVIEQAQMIILGAKL